MHDKNTIGSKLVYRIFVITGFALITTLIFSGCTEPRYYNLTVFNRSGADVKEFTIFWNGKAYDYPPPHSTPIVNGVGFLVDGPFSGDIPSDVKCTWNDANGRFHQSILIVPQPRKDQGNSITFCFFIFPDQTMKVAAISNEQWDNDEMFVIARNGAPSYDVNLMNRTGKTIKDVTIYFGKYCVLKDKMLSPYRKDHKLNPYSAGMNQRTHGLPYEITENARIEWEDHQGVKHEQVIPLKKKLPADLNERTIYFTIGDNGQVVLSTVPSKEFDTIWFDHDFLTDKGDLNK